jgi:hypothetical protein
MEEQSDTLPTRPSLANSIRLLPLGITISSFSLSYSLGRQIISFVHTFVIFSLRVGCLFFFKNFDGIKLPVVVRFLEEEAEEEGGGFPLVSDWVLAFGSVRERTSPTTVETALLILCCKSFTV